LKSIVGLLLAEVLLRGRYCLYWRCHILLCGCGFFHSVQLLIPSWSVSQLLFILLCQGGGTGRPWY